MKEAIPRIASYRSCKYLYLAMHGSEHGLSLFNDDKLSCTELRNLLVSIKETSGSSLYGLYLSSCLFGTERLAKYLFDADIDCKWIVGYKDEVDWLHSAALDLLFYRIPINEGDGTEGALGAIERTANRLRSLAFGLIRELGFDIFVRKPRIGGAESLFAR